MKSDFTQGSVARKLLNFSLPILFSNLLQASLLLITGLWVGNLLGSAAFAAVTVSTSIVVVLLAFVMGVNNATLTVFAQLKGAGNQAETSSYLSAFTFLLTSLSLAIGLLGYLLAGPMLAFINTPASIMDQAKEYLQVMFIGTLFLTGYNFIGSLLRAFGDSRTPMYFVLLATLLTALLNPLFIAGLNMGVAGAAWAMILSQGLAFLYSLFYLSGRSGVGLPAFKIQRPKAIEIRTILELGVPSGIQMIVIYAGMTVILSLVNSFGEDVVAGFGAAQRLDNIILLPAIALGAAVNAMAAQNIGANQWARITDIAKIGIGYNVAVMGAFAATLFICAEPLVKLFISDQGSVDFGVSYLRTIALFYPFIGLNFILNGIVRGAGAMFQILALNIISLWLLRVPLAYWITSLYHERGIALGIGISFLISSLFSIAYYRWGGWRSKRLFTRQRQ
ncbi:MATE family efflux transporter [Aliidiomarina taiwanensis]|uniref:MATE family efflux transporter n=1 Tax=Aliidiomarina taiwanensis TaxID=946228 RepID=A0A432XA58_9GAMM|nr:MATE family efflux transporter [Aliidiomarina taiwanensis]RUO44295.1 MATE family efflux transporter [Aliidiomarina taiwanensis]